jgi:cytochrome P450
MSPPPGPKGHWLYGHLTHIREDRLAFFTRMRDEFGDVVRVRVVNFPIYLLFHPDAVEEVLVKHNYDVRKHFALRINPLVLGKGLLTSEGDFWLRQRRLSQPAFLKAKLALYGQTMIDAAQRLTQAWQPGEARDMHEEFSKLTLDIAARTLFSSEVGGEAGDIVEAMHILQAHFLVRFNSLVRAPVWVPTPWNLRFRKAIRRLDAVLFRFIRQRRESGERKNDLLSLLLDARDEVGGGQMTDRQVRDEAMTLFLAGHETTALALSWTWLLLARHPHVEAELAREWSAVLGDRDIVPDDWGRLPRTEHVILEAMRLYPPAYVVGREALREITVAGHRVPRGMTLLMPQWAIHRDPRWWDRPDEFRPERWAEDKIKSLPKFAYFPFGGGPRTCIGNQFATMEMVLTLATIGRRFRFGVDSNVDVRPQATFTLRPQPGVPTRVLVR